MYIYTTHTHICIYKYFQMYAKYANTVGLLKHGRDALSQEALYVYMHVYMYIYIYVYINIYIHIHLYICTYVHIYIYVFNSSIYMCVLIFKKCLPLKFHHVSRLHPTHCNTLHITLQNTLQQYLPLRFHHVGGLRPTWH